MTVCSWRDLQLQNKFYCQPRYVFIFLFVRYYHYWLACPDIWTRLLLHKLHHLWLPLSLIFGMGTLKISYIWSYRGLPPGPLCLLLYLTLYTILQELEDSLQLPKYHRHIHRFVLIILHYNIIIQYYNPMGPPLYMRSVVDRNVVMRRMTVLSHRCWETPSRTY